MLEYLRARGASVGRQSQRYSALRYTSARIHQSREHPPAPASAPAFQIADEPSADHPVPWKPRRQSAQARTALVTRQPYCLRERAAPRELLRSFDKCFAAAWLDDDRCVVGTKDNKLAIVRASNLHAPAHQVRLPRRLFEPPERLSSRTTRPLRPLPPPPPPPPPNRVAESRVDDAVARVRAAANHAHHASSNATDVNDAAASERVRRVRFRGDAPSYDVAQGEMDRVRAGAGPHARVVGAGVGWSPRGHADNCGIHAVAINASRTRMATGAANPADAAVFSLPDVRPTALLTGHTDWVFGLDWVTDNLLASGSRDGTVKLWTVPDEPAGYGRGSSGYGRDDDAAASPSYAQISSDPNDTLVFHYDKVRDLKWCERSGRLVSVSTDGRVCFSDVERVAAVEEKRIRGKRELVCVATDGATCAAGSQSHITVFDHRVGGIVRDERLVDNSSDGVRSLSFAGDGRVLTCGGGGGKLTFFDMRAGAFLPVTAPDPGDIDPAASWFGSGLASPSFTPSPSASPPRYSSGGSDASIANRRRRDCLVLDTGEGWLDREHHVFVEHFSRAEVLNACYAHAWDETGTRLLVAGGPLAYGLRGCYVGVWS